MTLNLASVGTGLVQCCEAVRISAQGVGDLLCINLASLGYAPRCLGIKVITCPVSMLEKSAAFVFPYALSGNVNFLQKKKYIFPIVVFFNRHDKSG